MKNTSLNSKVAVADAFSMSADQRQSSNDLLKWDVLVLTARNRAHKRIFQQQLANLQTILGEFCTKFMVLADDDDDNVEDQEGIRIGSGGATLNALLRLEEQQRDNCNSDSNSNNFFATHRVLLLHSGGLSQRIPHVSLIGKAFMLMPDGCTLLEHKLHMYRNLLRALNKSKSTANGFVFIASADVLEHINDDADFDQNLTDEQFSELILIAHYSPLEVAIQHGVYVLQKGNGKQSSPLWRVLQKPNMQQLRQIPDAIITTKSRDYSLADQEMALTDSCYLLAGSFATELLDLRKQHGPVHCELCCYRDFLCPLGTTTDQEQKKAHFTSKDSILLKWQQLLWDIIHTRSAQLINLGPESFFHFGTAPEVLHHFLDRSSAFWCKFLENSTSAKSNMINCIVEKSEKISSKSFLESCHLTGDIGVGDGCILSGLYWLEGPEQCDIPPNICAVTIPISRCLEKENCGIRYVTACFHRDADLKAHLNVDGALHWFKHKICHSESTSPTTRHSQSLSSLSLWECPLFRPALTSTQSLRSTLWAIEHGPGSNQQNGEDGWPLLSISEVLTCASVPELLRQREQLKKHAKALHSDSHK